MDLLIEPSICRKLLVTGCSDEKKAAAVWMLDGRNECVKEMYFLCHGKSISLSDYGTYVEQCIDGNGMVMCGQQYRRRKSPSPASSCSPHWVRASQGMRDSWYLLSIIGNIVAVFVVGYSYWRCVAGKRPHSTYKHNYKPTGNILHVLGERERKRKREET